MLVIFPFEVSIYEQAGVPVQFVGHPLVDLAVARRNRAEVVSTLGLDPGRPIVALLPGSRPNELHYILPDLVAAARLVRARLPEVQFLVARAPSLADSLFDPLDALRADGVPIGVVEGATDDVLAASDVVLTASGTATVQTALHGRPMVIVYRVSGGTYTIGRVFVRLRTYGMVNLIAGRRIVSELVQHDFTPENVAREAISLLTDHARAEKMRRDLAEVRDRLGAPGASHRAAEAILQLTHET
jgi:lipid-A-disaccharide synthase